MYARGKKALAICQRSGFKVPRDRITREPGTNYYVDINESDEDYSLIAHPQNYPPKKTKEAQALPIVYKDVELSLGTVVSADVLSTPLYLLSIS